MDSILKLDTDMFEAYMNYSAASANGALDPQTRELVYIAVNASPTALNTFSMELHIRKALDLGVTVDQIMEVFELVACLGIHSVTVGIPAVNEVLKERGEDSNMAADINKDMFKDLIGRGCGARKMEYDWRGCGALRPGRGRRENTTSPTYFEQNPGGLKILPTFALLPYLNNVSMEPLRHVPYAPNEIVGDFITEKLGYLQNRLHMAMDLTLHRPLPTGGRLPHRGPGQRRAGPGRGKGRGGGLPDGHL